MPRPMKPIIGMSCEEDERHLQSQPPLPVLSSPLQTFLPTGRHLRPGLELLPFWERGPGTFHSTVPAFVSLTPQSLSEGDLGDTGAYCRDS